MNDTGYMDEKSYLKQVFNSPQTQGEVDQSEKLKKLGSSPDSILKLNSKLEELKQSLVDNQDVLEKRITDLKRVADIPSKKRLYDKSILTKTPSNFFNSILSYGKTKRAFFKKYKNEKYVKWSFWNLLLYGSAFHPGYQSHAFVKNLVGIQESLKNVSRLMYKKGWLNEIGTDILTPLEFNLIGHFERVIQDLTLVNYMMYYKQPQTAIKKINPFLGYYLSVTQDTYRKEMLTNAIEKSLREIVYENVAANSKINQTMEMVRTILSGRVKKEFIVPLFETAFLRPIHEDEIYGYVTLQEINDTEYNADPKLMLVMTNRKRQHTEKIKKKIVSIEKEMSFISSILEALNTKQKMPDGSMGDLADYSLYQYYNKNFKLFSEGNKNIARFVVSLCEVFFNNYEYLLEGEVNVKIDHSIKKVKIFEPSIFIKEIAVLKTEMRMFSDFIREEYSFQILKEQKFSKKKQYFIDSLNKVVDAFYNIGEKLFDVENGHRKKIVEGGASNTTITEKKYNSSVIPYHDKTLARQYSTGESSLSLINKTIEEGVNTIEKFCFAFAYKFEYPYRNFADTLRKESIKEKIERLNTLREALSGLESYEDLSDVV